MLFVQLRVYANAVIICPPSSEATDLPLPTGSTSPCHTEESNSSRPSMDFPTTSTPDQPRKKRKVTKSDEVDDYILRSLKDIEEKQAQRQDDEDELYGRQVAATIRRFTNREKALAKLRIQQVLLDIEFPAA